MGCVLQARDGALLEVEELRHEVADLRRMASPVKALRMSRSDSEDEDPLGEQVNRLCWNSLPADILRPGRLSGRGHACQPCGTVAVWTIGSRLSVWCPEAVALHSRAPMAPAGRRLTRTWSSGGSCTPALRAPCCTRSSRPRRR